MQIRRDHNTYLHTHAPHVTRFAYTRTLHTSVPPFSDTWHKSMKTLISKKLATNVECKIRYSNVKSLLNIKQIKVISYFVLYCW